MESWIVRRARVTALVCGAVTLAALLPSPARAWELTSLRTGVYRISRSASDSTGTVNIYRTSEGMNTYLGNGSWDQTSGGPSYAWVVGIKFDEDDYSVEMNAPVSVMSYFYLVCFPGGTASASLVSMVTPVSLQTSQGVPIETLAVSLSALPTASVTGTVGVSNVASVAVVNTPSVSLDASSIVASVGVEGTLPVDPWSTAGLPVDGLTLFMSLVSATGGLLTGKAVLG